MLSRQNFAVYVVEIEPDVILDGHFFEAGTGLDINDDIEFTQGSFTISSSGNIKSLASVFITQELFGIFQSNTPPNQLTRLIFVAYDISSPLFQDPNVNGTGSIILSVLQSPLQSTIPPADLEEPVRFQFQSKQVFQYIMTV